ncbi:MAG: hypothetical protein KM310_11595 [Clostridiales bacterium]|nr:hypothetical protein [Clostridiales bacterium]
MVATDACPLFHPSLRDARIHSKDGVLFQIKGAAAEKPIQVALEEVTSIAGNRGKAYEILRLDTLIVWYTDKHHVRVFQRMLIENTGEELLKELRGVASS